eukprot:COSAG01_NODE_201_length_22135_cov_408.324288_15_plen_58_part_00
MRARLARELQMLEREPPPGVCAWLKDDRDIDKILAQVNGVEVRRMRAREHVVRVCAL